LGWFGAGIVVARVGEHTVVGVEVGIVAAQVEVGIAVARAEVGIVVAQVEEHIAVALAVVHIADEQRRPLFEPLENI